MIQWYKLLAHSYPWIPWISINKSRRSMINVYMKLYLSEKHINHSHALWHKFCNNAFQSMGDLFVGEWGNGWVWKSSSCRKSTLSLIALKELVNVTSVRAQMATSSIGWASLWVRWNVACFLYVLAHFVMYPWEALSLCHFTPASDCKKSVIMNGLAKESVFTATSSNRCMDSA